MDQITMLCVILILHHHLCVVMTIIRMDSLWTAMFSESDVFLDQYLMTALKDSYVHGDGV